MIGKDGEKESENPVLPARLNDDDDNSTVGIFLCHCFL